MVCIFCKYQAKCLEVAAEICFCLAMEVMLENWMADIFFFQSVLERFYFSRTHWKYVLMIQVLLFKDNNTIENFLQNNAVCFFMVFVTPPSSAPRSLAFMMSLSCYSSVTDHVILSEQHDEVRDVHQPQINF